MDGWMDGSMDGWIDRWTDGWIDGWMGRSTDGGMKSNFQTRKFLTSYNLNQKNHDT